MGVTGSATYPVHNELCPRGVDARAPSALERVPSMRFDATEASVTALLASCRDAASERPEGRPKAACIARATRARAPLPMRRSPPGGTAIRGAPAAAAGRARHRALPQMRRCAPGFARVYCPECLHDCRIQTSYTSSRRCAARKQQRRERLFRAERTFPIAKCRNSIVFGGKSSSVNKLNRKQKEYSAFVLDCMAFLPPLGQTRA